MKKREITKFQPDGIKLKSKKAFTLAEVLITLGIIGIVAALTIPGLMSRNEERVRATQLKKAYSVLAQTHQMMIVQDIYPYREFVEPFMNEEPNETPSEPSNPGGSDDTDTDGGSGSDSGDSGGSGDSGDSGGSGDDGGDKDPTIPDMNDQTTKELVDGLIDAVFHFDFGTAKNNFDKLVDKYGFNNVGPFLLDYASDSGVDLPDFIKDILGGNKNKIFHIGNDLYRYAYLHLLATTSETTASDEDMANFTKVKKYQLEVLKKLLNGASYCPSYDQCNGAEPIEYTTLDGTPAEIEAAEFENSALKTSDGMYLWLGDINNPQRYYIDINGAKRPNKLGVDVFTFDIIKKESIRPEQNDNCTMTGSPVDGDAYKGLGCAGYALIDLNPDRNSKGYWRNFR